MWRRSEMADLLQSLPEDLAILCPYLWVFERGMWSSPALVVESGGFGSAPSPEPWKGLVAAIGGVQLHRRQALS